MRRAHPFIFGLVLALGGATGGAAADGAAAPPSACRSNGTHLAWRTCGSGGGRPDTVNDEPVTVARHLTREQQRRRLQRDGSIASLQHGSGSDDDDDDDDDNDDCSCSFESLDEARTAAYRYLRRHVMEFDLPFLSTLGFPDDDAGGAALGLPDGLDGGLVGPTIEYAVQAKRNFTWADDLPRGIFYEYVLSYANVNEARSNWRPLLHQKLYDIVGGDATSARSVPDVVLALNTHMWRRLAPRQVDAITFVGGQTPLIFDPMSVLAFGQASCTGLAILFVNALRTFGVPARVVGTPAWRQVRGHGNHNWVEVWWDGHWRFLEPSATRTNDPDSLHRDPCARWFCHPDRFDDSPNTTRVFAARLETPAGSNTFFRMAWEWDSLAVPGEDVSSYYQAVCSQC